MPGRSNGGISVYIPPKSVYLKKNYMVVLLLWPRTDSIWYMFTCGTLTYVLKLQWLKCIPPNQIPGYAPDYCFSLVSLCHETAYYGNWRAILIWDFCLSVRLSSNSLVFYCRNRTAVIHAVKLHTPLKHRYPIEYWTFSSGVYSDGKNCVLFRRRFPFITRRGWIITLHLQ